MCPDHDRRPDWTRPWLKLAGPVLVAFLAGCAGTPMEMPSDPGTGGDGGSGGSGGSGGGGSGGRGGTGGSGGAGGSGGSGGSSTVTDARPIDNRPPDLAVDNRPLDTAPADTTPRDTTPPPPPAGCGFATVVSRAAFDGMFPPANRNAVYTYDALVASVTQLYPSFASTGRRQHLQEGGGGLPGQRRPRDRSPAPHRGGQQVRLLRPAQLLSV